MAAIPNHLIRLVDNASEVQGLIKIHERVSGKGAGRRHALEVLNKSGIVLLVACWEKFVEDVATEAFRLLLDKANEPTVFPNKVLALASRDLRSDSNELKVWDLAGLGWKPVLTRHGDRILEKFIRPFNSPKAANVDELFDGLFGIRRISNQWSWSGMSSTKVCAKLDELIDLRGAIAHEVKAGKPVYKTTVVQHIHFIKRLGGVFNNCVAIYLGKRLGEDPWGLFDYVGHKRRAS